MGFFSELKNDLSGGNDNAASTDDKAKDSAHGVDLDSMLNRLDNIKIEDSFEADSNAGDTFTESSSFGSDTFGADPFGSGSSSMDFPSFEDSSPAPEPFQADTASSGFAAAQADTVQGDNDDFLSRLSEALNSNTSFESAEGSSDIPMSFDAGTSAPAEPEPTPAPAFADFSSEPAPAAEESAIEHHGSLSEVVSAFNAGSDAEPEPEPVPEPAPAPIAEAAPEPEPEPEPAPAPVYQEPEPEPEPAPAPAPVFSTPEPVAPATFGFQNTAFGNQNEGGYQMDHSVSTATTDENAIITTGMVVNGDITSTGNMELLGKVTGNVQVQGKLTIGGEIDGDSSASEVYAESARINGEIRSQGSVKVGQSTVIIGNIFATGAVIAGAVKGDIDVHGPVILDTTAIVMGNIKSQSVQINNGAVIEGMCSQTYAEVNPSAFFEGIRPKTVMEA